MGKILVRVTLTEPEWTAVRKAALDANLSAADWAGHALRKALPKHVRDALPKGAKP